MRKKALILGALPIPFKGPWVRIDECERWVLDVEQSLDGVYIEIDDDYRLHLDTVCELAIQGKRARVVVTKELDVKRLTLILEEEEVQHAGIQS